MTSLSSHTGLGMCVYHLSVILLLLLLLYLITFMKGIYNYISETNHAPTVFSVVVILQLHLLLLLLVGP